MKSFIIVLIGFFILAGCQNEENVPTSASSQDPQVLDKEHNDNEKVVICHVTGSATNPYVTLEVSVNALDAHLAHGDFVADADGDGYTAVGACTGSADDCDDNNPAINPGAEEVCDNGIDDDCDGEIDEDCVTSCVDGEFEVTIDPDGVAGNGDEYILYVYPADNSAAIEWSTSYSNTGARDDWDGASNTAAIVNDQGAGTGYAAGLCASLSTNGCDWYLPSKLELKEMITQLGPSGNMQGFYWSSTESPLSGTWDPTEPDRAWRQVYSGPGGSFLDIAQDNKALDFGVRCVRR